MSRCSGWTHWKCKEAEDKHTSQWNNLQQGELLSLREDHSFLCDANSIEWPRRSKCGKSLVPFLVGFDIFPDCRRNVASKGTFCLSFSHGQTDRQTDGQTDEHRWQSESPFAVARCDKKNVFLAFLYKKKAQRSPRKLVSRQRAKGRNFELTFIRRLFLNQGSVKEWDKRSSKHPWAKVRMNHGVTEVNVISFNLPPLKAFPVQQRTRLLSCTGIFFCGMANAKAQKGTKKGSENNHIVFECHKWLAHWKAGHLGLWGRFGRLARAGRERCSWFSDTTRARHNCLERAAHTFGQSAGMCCASCPRFWRVRPFSWNKTSNQTVWTQLLKPVSQWTANLILPLSRSNNSRLGKCTGSSLIKQRELN